MRIHTDVSSSSSSSSFFCCFGVERSEACSAKVTMIPPPAATIPNPKTATTFKTVPNFVFLVVVRIEFPTTKERCMDNGDGVEVVVAVVVVVLVRFGK
jgi:hypothetical protein